MFIQKLVVQNNKNTIIWTINLTIINLFSSKQEMKEQKMPGFKQVV